MVRCLSMLGGRDGRKDRLRLCLTPTYIVLKHEPRSLTDTQVNEFLKTQRRNESKAEALCPAS